MSSDLFYLGLIAGEGSFQVKIEQTSDSSVRFAPHFSMTMHEQDILNDLQDYLSVGEVYDDTQNDARYSLFIRAFDDVKHLRDWVESVDSSGFETSDKYRQFKLWSEAIDINDREKYSNPLTADEKRRLVDISYDIPKSNTKDKSREEWIEIVESSGPYYCGKTNEDGSKCKRRVTDEHETCRSH